MLIFDSETDGLLDHLTKIHCLVIYDTKDDSATIYDPQSHPIEEGIKRLMEAPSICGHNIIGFDIPAIKKVYPWFDFEGEKVDTLTISRVTYPDIKQGDYGRYRKGILPPNLIGSYSLKAWGYRMEVFKGDFGETTDWQEWTPSMSKYCIQDVKVTWTLYKRLKSARPLDPTCFHLEHRVAEIISQQERNGFLFDVRKADALVAVLGKRRAELQHQLIPMFPPWYKFDKEFTPKKDNKRYNYIDGASMSQLKLIEFNPNSRQHVAHVLKHHFGWEPTEFTENSGEPKIDDEILSKLPWPEAQLIGEYMMIQKRLGQVAEGEKAWLKYYKLETGRIHGAVITNGAVTGRMTHHSPNMAQVPSVDAPYGTECRGCFIARPGFKIVGCDASGLEARCLSHFMATYDEGAYIDIILNGRKEDGTDVHGRNMKALGLPKPLAKRWFYAWCYGAGDDLLGEIAGGDKSLGAKLRRKFLKAFPAIGKLIEAVQERKVIRGLDGRLVPVRAKHSALNTLLQGAGAVIMKLALVYCDDRLSDAGIEYYFVANVHDEFQIEVREEQAGEAGEIARQAIVDAGKYFNFRCPLDAEYKIGDSWAETH